MRLIPDLSQLLLCLILLASSTTFAQASEAVPAPAPAPVAEATPPLAPAAESPAEPSPRGQVFPREEQKEEGAGSALRVGRLVLQLPAGVLLGAGLGAAGYLLAGVVLVIDWLFLDEVLFKGHEGSVLLAGTALAATVGAGLGVGAVGALLKGRGQLRAALVGAFLGGGLALGIGWRLDASGRAAVLGALVCSSLGATVAYAISEARAPERTSTAADEHASLSVLPMLGPTRSGGVVAGLVGRF